MQRRLLVAGNWKMHGSTRTNAELVAALKDGISSFPEIEVLVCPPTIYVESVGRALTGTSILLGAQHLCDQVEPGAFTGETQGAMLVDVGCSHVIVGHSERRALYSEDDHRVAANFGAALAAGLKPILCVGETLAEREAGATEAVLSRQLHAVIDDCGIAALRGSVLAYEPVWAIGTGRTATPVQAQSAHAFLRAELRTRDAIIATHLQILYGGSVKADNAAALFANDDIDGGLIGGASLKAADFLAICGAAQKQAQSRRD